MNDLIPNLETTGLQSYAVEFDSIGRAVRLAQARGVARGASADVVDRRIADTSGTPWANGATFEKINRWLVEPKSDLLEVIDRIKRRIEDSIEAPTRQRRKLRRDREEGDELDPQAVLERRADGWTAVEHSATPKHVVTIAVNLSVSASCNPSDLLYRGAATAALADLLTQSGHSVEVVGFLTSVNPGDVVRDLVQRLVIKRADSPLDVASLAVATAEIGFFRMVMLRNTGRVIPGRVLPGFGRVRNMHASELTDVDVCMEADIFTQEAAVRAVREAMSKIAEPAGRVAR